jgi:hypothetical protein
MCSSSRRFKVYFYSKVFNEFKVDVVIFLKVPLITSYNLTKTSGSAWMMNTDCCYTGKDDLPKARDIPADKNKS